MIQRIFNVHPLLSLFAYRKGWVDNPVSGTGLVYLLVDPRNKEVRYVGQTSRHFSMRLMEHTDSPGNATDKWVYELIEKRLRPEMVIVTYAPRFLLDAIEYGLIAFGETFLGWRLLNIRRKP